MTREEALKLIAPKKITDSLETKESIGKNVLSKKKERFMEKGTGKNIFVERKDKFRESLKVKGVGKNILEERSKKLV